MGVCGIKTNYKNPQVNAQNTRTQSEVHNQVRTSSSNKKDEEKNKPEFNDFEEDKSGKMIDEGIKQIPSYKCPIPFDELKELRERFWQSKIKTNRRWKAIREICESDALTAVQLLEAAGFVCKENLKQIMEIENFDVIYRVPNFCIADPVFERDYNALVANKDNYETRDIAIVLYSSMTNKETKLTVSNKMKGKELKEVFSKAENFPLNKYWIRLFYSGQEIKDDYMLYYSSLDNNSKLQVMCLKKE